MNPGVPEEQFQQIMSQVMGGMPNGQMTIDPQQQQMMPPMEQLGMMQDDFYANQVGNLDPSLLSNISDNLRRGIEGDLSSRAQWEQRLANGIKQLGFVVDVNPQDYSIASNIFSSTFVQAALSTVAEMCSVLLPPTGPTRMKITDPVKDPNMLKELMNKSNNVTSFMNNLLTDYNPDFYPETEQAFFWAAMYGSCFKKVYFDEIQMMPVSPIIKPQDLIVNSNAVTLRSASRITHRFYITQKELKTRQALGIYADVPLIPYRNYTDSVVETIMSNIAGVTQNIDDGDDTYLYQLDETRGDLVVPQLQGRNPAPCPYLITREKESGAVLGFHRNWEQKDPYCRRINDIIKYPFFHGMGIYGLGYIHIMGSNAEAATELLRQLIFAGKMANFPAFVRSKGMRMDNNTIRLQPGECAEIETGNKSVQDCLMHVPTKSADPIFKELKDDLENNITKSMNAMNAAVADINPNAPVGTTLALIEQASKVETSITKRLYKAMGEELNLIYQITISNFDKMQQAFAIQGKNFAIQKEDLLNNFQILPTADPNLASSTHLLMQSEALSALYTQFPQLLNARPVVELKLRALKVDNLETYLVPEPGEIQPRDPATENMDLIQGKPAKAALEQNHQAHIITHSALLSDPNIAQDPMKQAGVQAHLQEHYAMYYKIRIEEAMGGQQLPQDGAPQDMQAQNQVAQQAAQATEQLIKEQQAILSAQNPQQVDPNQVLMADIQSKKEATEHKSQIELLKAENDKYKADLDFEARQRELALKEKEIDQKYHIQDSELEHQRNIQEREMMMEHLKQENETIRTQVQEIMKVLSQSSDQQHQQEQAQQQQEADKQQAQQQQRQKAPQQ